MAGAAVRNSEIASGTSSRRRKRFPKGDRCRSAPIRPSLFPQGYARIIDWAEKHRGLPEALHMAGEMFEAQARAQAGFVSTVCGVPSHLVGPLRYRCHGFGHFRSDDQPDQPVVRIVRSFDRISVLGILNESLMAPGRGEQATRRLSRRSRVAVGAVRDGRSAWFVSGESSEY